MESDYFGPLTKLTTLQETQSSHDSMNIPKIEFISEMFLGSLYCKHYGPRSDWGVCFHDKIWDCPTHENIPQ